MARLNVSNLFSIEIYSLGKNKPIFELGDKRITTAVRKQLRATCGPNSIVVSCNVSRKKNLIEGNCKINDTKYKYQIV